MKRIGAFALLLTCLALAASAQAQTKVRLAVGGKPAMFYLPLTVVERLGYFKDAGLDVEISDFPGGARALQSLIGGSADVVAGAFDHTIQMQAKGQSIVAVVELGQFPGFVLGVLTTKASAYRNHADLKGFKIGITAPGSSTHFMARYLMAQAGLKDDDAAFIGIGAGPTAVAAARHGEIDALVNVDPVMSLLESEKAIKVVADTRTLEGTRQVYGGNYPAVVLYVTPAYAKANGATVQALTNAMVRALLWLQAASPQQVLATVPEDYLLGNKAMYLFAFNNVKTAYSKDGLMSEAGARTTLKALASFNPQLDPAKINLAETYTNEFAKKALAKYGKKK